MAVNPANPPRSGESDGKSGVSLTEHMDRIGRLGGGDGSCRCSQLYPVWRCGQCQIRESLTAIREQAVMDARAIAILPEVLRALALFARVWNSRPPLDVTSPFRVECEIGEYGAWADVADLHDRLSELMADASDGKSGVKDYEQKDER